MSQKTQILQIGTIIKTEFSYISSTPSKSRNRLGILSALLALFLGFCAARLCAANGAAPAGEDLMLHVFGNLNARTNGSPRLFSTQIGGTNFVRNPQFWLHGLNGLTGTHVGYGPGASAITPWHILGANHYKHDVGSQVCFADLHGHAVIRTVVAGCEIRPDIKSDIWLGVLDSALPASITPMSLMPAGWINLVNKRGLPVAAMNQNGCFGAAALISARQPAAGWFSHGYAYLCLGITPALQFEPLRGGDSGHPIVTVVETNLILLGHITFEVGGDKLAGPDYSSYASDIQAAIATLGTDTIAKAQKIKILDLTRFQ